MEKQEELGCCSTNHDFFSGSDAIFTWAYGKIEELSEEEKSEVNQILRQGRKSYQKHCALCGRPGSLAYRKISDGNPALICKACAETYVMNAVKLSNEGVGVSI